MANIKTTNKESKTFVKRIVGFSMASWVNCIISFIATPILTSLFVPAELGKINLFISYINILVPFAYMGFDQAYVRFFNEPCGKNTKKSLFKLCLSISLILTAIVSIIVMLFWKYFSKSIIGYNSLVVACCLVLYLFAFVILRYTNLKARMDNAIWPYFIQSVISTIIIKVSFVTIAFVNPKAEYAISFRAVLLLLAACFFCFFALKKCLKDKVDKSKKTIKELTKYAVPLFPTVFLIMLNVSLAQIFLKQYVDYDMIGIYSNAVTIAGIITIMQSGLNTFWTPFVYEYHKEKQKIQKMHHIISFLLIGLALVIILFKDLIYLLLVNKQYWESKAIMPLLLVSPVCETISETLGLGIELSKKTYLKFPVYIINIAVNILSCVFLIPKYGLLGAAIANALASISLLIAKTIIGERYYKCSDNYFRLIISMIILIAVTILNYYINNVILQIGITLGAILLLCYIYKNTVVLLLYNGKNMLSEVLHRKADYNDKNS